MSDPNYPAGVSDRNLEQRMDSFELPDPNKPKRCECGKPICRDEFLCEDCLTESRIKDMEW